MQRTRRLQLAVFLSVLLGLLYSHAGSSTVRAAVTWRACSTFEVDEKWIALLKERLECGVMWSPVAGDDHTQGYIGIDMVRVKATRPKRLKLHPKGTIFFNFGGPGRDPRRILPNLAYVLDDNTTSRLTTLALQFDLVAVVPRGLSASPCDSIEEPHTSILDLDEADWANVAHDAEVGARRCNGNQIVEHMGLRQHVEDMERARVALGERKLDFVGYSYGAWAGIAYAAAHPESTGHIVLDSPVNWTATLQEHLDEEPGNFQALFTRRVLLPGSAGAAEANNVLARLQEMPPRARKAWGSLIDTREDLLAVLAMAPWVAEDASIDSEKLVNLIRKHRFDQDWSLNQAVRAAALRLAPSISATPFGPPAGINRFVYYRTLCGESPWANGTDRLRAASVSHTALHPAATHHIFTGLICSLWPPHAEWSSGQPPALAQWRRHPPILILQAEYDPVTSARSADKAFAASPDAFMVIVGGTYGHGLFGVSESASADYIAASYLLQGELPDRQVIRTERVTPRAKDVGPSDKEEERRRLREILRRS